MVVHPKDVDVSKLKFSCVKTLHNGIRLVYFNYEGSNLRIQTPKMNLPYGVDSNKDIISHYQESSLEKRYDIKVSFCGMDSTRNMKDMYDKMLEIEKMVIDKVFENRMTWLQHDYDGVKDIVTQMLCPIIKHDRNKITGKIENRYPPTMKLKLPYDNQNDAFTFKCDDIDGCVHDFKNVMHTLKGCQAQFVIELGGLWLAGGRFGCTWKVVRARIQHSPNKHDIDFIKDCDEVQVSRETVKVTKTSATSVMRLIGMGLTLLVALMKCKK